MEGFCCHPEPLLGGFHGCTNLDEAAAAAAMASEFECSTSSPPLSMAMQQLQGSFLPSVGAEAAGGKGRMSVSIERSSTTTSLGSAQEMDGSGSSSRKNKRSNANVASAKGKRASRGHGVDGKVEEEAAGYIHVRARRGQATDSHSVAERLRREKINEKMKMLQSLVPGCDKIAGKALLDEIISYVHSLQNQVEFLSMKLATLNPMMVYELGLDTDAPQVLKTAETPPQEETVQWMGQATGAASLAAEAQEVPTGATAGLAQDGSSSSRVNLMQLQVQQEEEELSKSSFSGRTRASPR